MRLIIKLFTVAMVGFSAIAQAQLTSGAASLATSTPLASAPVSAPLNTHSRPPVPFRFLRKDELAQLMYRPGNTQSYIVTDHENYDVEYVTRALITDHIECHMHFLDYVTVLDGEGTLSYGGTPVDPIYRNPSEPTGTRMTGATLIKLHPGDYVVVPAGVWHSFSGTADHKLTYVIFKQRE
jgi:hypothetical protein